MRFPVSLFVVMLLFWNAALISAEELLSLSEAISRAYARSSASRIPPLQMASVRADSAVSLAYPNPVVELEAGREGKVSWMQPLPTPGERTALRLLASARLATAEIDSLAHRIEWEATLARSYWEWWLADALFPIAEHQAALADTLLLLAQHRLREAVGTDLEVIRAQAGQVSARLARARVKAEIMRQQSTAVRHFGEDLKRIRPQFSSTDLAFSSIDQIPHGNGSLPERIAAGHTSLRVFGASRRQIAAQRHLVAATAGFRWQAGPQLSWTRDEVAPGIALSVTLPVWDNGRRELARLDVESQRLEADSVDATSRLLTASAETSAEWSGAVARLQALSHVNIDSLMANLPMAFSRVREGWLPLTLALDLEQIVLELAAERVKAAAECELKRIELGRILNLPVWRDEQ